MVGATRTFGGTATVRALRWRSVRPPRLRYWRRSSIATGDSILSLANSVMEILVLVKPLQPHTKRLGLFRM